MKSYKLGEIASFFQGKQVDLENQFLNKDENHNVRFVRIVDYTNSDEPIRYIENLGEKYYARKGDLVMIRYGSQTAGKVVMGKSGIIANNMFKINLDNTVANNEFMYYYLSQPHIFDYLRRAQSSSTMPAINFGMLNNFEVMIPNIDIQEKIVSILKKLDDRIKINTQINDNLYELGDVLYKEYYSKYENELPNGYKYLNLNEVSVNFDSKRKPMSSREREQHKGIYTYYGATSIIDYVDDYIFDDTYLLMGEDGTVKTNEGYPVLQYIWGKSCINNHTHVLQGTIISTEHLMFALIKKNIETLITGAVQPKINQENMNKIKIIIATDDINIKFEEQIKIIVDKIKFNSIENITLTQLRNTLLPKLMNEKIDLNKIEV